MKKLLYILAFLPLFAFGQISKLPPPDTTYLYSAPTGIIRISSDHYYSTFYYGLMAYYPFNGNANDESGNENDGTVYGATLTTDRFENDNSAYSFDGVDDYILLPGLFLNDEWTISFWQYKSSVQTDVTPTLIFVNDGDGSDVWIYNTGTGNNNLVLDRNTGGFVTWGGILNSDVWQYITITFNYNGGANTTYAYVNGVQQAVKSFPHLNFSSPFNTLIGGYLTNFNFNGSIDEVIIYNRVLSEEEILQIYNYTP